MKKILLTLAVAVLSVAFASPTQAGPKNGGSKVSNVKVVNNNTKKVNVTPAKTPITKVESSKFKNYHLTFGVKFDKGVYYKGKNHQHWGQIRWDVRYGCYCYWDPCVRVWYYWCEPDVCYYPVTYVPYRNYCNCDVATAVEPVNGANIRPDGVSTASQEPPLNDIPAIPEPVNARQ